MKRLLLAASCCLGLVMTSSISAAAEEVIISTPHQDVVDMKKQLPKNAEILPDLQLILTDLTTAEQRTFHQAFPDSTIEKNTAVTLLNEPTKPTWNLSLLRIPVTPASLYTGKNVKVAVIDTGVATIPSLQHAIKQRLVFAPDDPNTTVNEADSIDRGHNGLGHGTLVTSIIAAKPYLLNGFSQGIAPDVQIYALKYADGTKRGSAFDIVRAIQWSIDHQIDFINLSSGLPNDLTALHQVIQKANKADILMIASTGNDGYYEKVRYPASYKEVVSVGAINRYQDISSFSNHQGRVDFLAPGEDVPAINRSGTVSYVTGTSFAAPHITGLLALLKERYPYSSSTQLVQKLKQMQKEKPYPILAIKAPVPLDRKPVISTRKVTDHEASFSLTNRKKEDVIVLQNERVIQRSKANKLTLKNLPANKKLTFSFRFVNADGDFSEVVTTTIRTKKDITKPQAPKQLTADLLPTGQVKLTWKQSRSKDFLKNILYMNGKRIKETREAQVIIPKLKKKKVYVFEVKAVDQAGNVSKSTTVRVIRYR
ncbi:S8 family serine peptidase [Kurthia sp. YJT4]|uniref:S8 family serine peptidase n=1 Tax=Kurthia sp. YJT4 TaxID=3049086 RepID=UPI00254F3B06|nr:S8 family serine peptidase [Kurthia sp. YJT4]WIL40112.1 S8 family serine peptidase [Kurthia sp. YJT4]